VTLIANQGLSGQTGLELIALDIFLWLAVLIWIDIDIYKAAWRLHQIETQVNELARETLLRWENQYGLGGVVAKYLIAKGLISWPPQSK
jgi:hypothetical protein